MISSVLFAERQIIPMKKRFPGLVKNRHSIRKFNGEHIPDETIEQILSLTALFVPSWGKDLVEFIVIRDRKIMADLAKCKAIGVGLLAYGDAAIVPIVDKRNLGLLAKDIAVVSTYTLHAAEHFGVTAYGIYIKSKQETTRIAVDDIRNLLGIPDYYGILNIVSLGMTDKAPEEQKWQTTIHYGKFGGWR